MAAKFPNLRLMHIFVTVAKHQGFASAQQDLNLTVSAISNYMSELEEKLGFVLCAGGGEVLHSRRKAKRICSKA